MSKVIQIKEAASLKDALNDLFITDDMDYFDNHSSNSFAIYAGLVALNDFLETGEEMLKGDECFDEKDFEYGIKIVNKCMERKAKLMGGKYTCVIKKVNEE